MNFYGSWTVKCSNEFSSRLNRCFVRLRIVSQKCQVSADGPKVLLGSERIIEWNLAQMSRRGKQAYKCIDIAVDIGDIRILAIALLLTSQAKISGNGTVDSILVRITS